MKDTADGKGSAETDDRTEPAAGRPGARKSAHLAVYLKRLFKVGYRPEKSYMRGTKP